MKKTFTLLLCLIASFITSRLSAQDVDVEWGKEQQFSKKGIISGIIGNDDNGYYAIRSSVGLFTKSSSTLIRYNMQHEVEFESEIKNEVPGGKGEWEGIYLLKDNIVLFLSRKDTKKDKNILYSCIITKDGKQGKPEEVDAIDIKSKRNAGGFITYLSEDRKKFLVVHLEIYDKKGYEKFSYKMFTEKLELVWEKPIELPYKDKNFDVKTCRIDEEGNVYVLGTVDVDKKTVQYKMFAYYFKKDRLEEVDISFAKAYAVASLRFNYYDNHIVLVGFYTNQKKTGLQGMIYTKINAKTLETVSEKNEPFSKKDLLKFTTERMARKGKGASTSFSIDDIIVMPNGEIKVVAEAFEIHVVTTQTQHGSSTTYYYYYMNIMVVNMDKDGKILWVSNVPKMQVSKNDGGIYSSYILGYDENNLYMVFNDHPKNTSPKTKEKKRGKYIANTLKVNKLSVTLAKVDNKGDVTTQMFFKSKNEGKTVLKPKIYSRFRQDNILIHAVKGKTYKFGFLNIKKA